MGAELGWHTATVTAMRSTLLLVLLAVWASMVCSSKQDIVMDIRDKLRPSTEASGGSSYALGGCGTGLHIYIDPVDNNNGVESNDNSVSTKVSIHEYIHLLQQSFLNGETTVTEGPVALKSDATSTTRFHVIYACDFSNQATYGTVHLAALNNMPDDYKLLAVPTYVILYPNDNQNNLLGCSTLTDEEVITRADEIYEEIYGSECDVSNAWMGNENHAFAEGAAEYHALNMAGVWSTFNGANYWTTKITDDKAVCDIPSGTYAGLFTINSGSSDDCDAVVDAYAQVSHQTCADNPIGEIVYSAFLDYCAQEGFSCTHKNLFEVWIQAGITGKLGWCDAFEEKYGKTWGEFVCYMEGAYGISSDCVAADVPCMAYSVDTGDGDDSSGIVPPYLLALFVMVVILVIGTFTFFHCKHMRQAGAVEKERQSAKVQDEPINQGQKRPDPEGGVGGYEKVVYDSITIVPES